MAGQKFQTTSTTMTPLRCYENKPEVEVSAPPFM